MINEKIVPKVYVADTETTGQFEPEIPDVVELAYAEITSVKTLGEFFLQRYEPAQPMLLSALATHHILPSELAGLPPSHQAKLPDDCYYLVGHNVDYDWRALRSPPDIKRICTLAMARRVWDDEQGHSLGACMYRIFPHEEARERLRNAHSAKFDAINAFDLLRHFLMIKGGSLSSWREVWLWSEDCRLPRTWTFGKHRGKKIGRELNGKADSGYHSWCLNQTTMDPYVKKALVAFNEGKL